MKCKLAFLLGMDLGQCFVWGMALKPLDSLYVNFRGVPMAWPEVYEHTKDFLEERVSGSKEYICDNPDLLALWAFLTNKECLDGFLASDFFAKDEAKYSQWLKNLFRFVCMVSEKFPSKTEYTLLLEKTTSVRDLCKNPAFEKWNSELEEILHEKIDWEDD